MKIYNDTIIYVLSSAYNGTGGALAIHQLCSALKRLDLNVKMVYFGIDAKKPDVVHPRLKKFHLPSAQTVDDDPKNIVIVPESLTHQIFLFQKSQIVVWWLSVDNHFQVSANFIDYYVAQNWLLTYPSPTFNPPKFFEYDHFYQSEYARLFLKVNQIPDEKIFSIKDYLDLNFLQQSSKIELSLKENIIAYNPYKGLEFTKKLVETAPDINFVPIKNMTPEEVQNLLARSKIYIDFGSHPGKDRISREAAMSHCVVITDRRGAADNPIDVPIDDDFKFEDTPENIPRIISKIRYVFENFQSEHDRQNSYRDIILHERDEFFDDVDSIFKTDSKPRMKIAIVGNLQDMEEICDELIHERGIEIVFAVNDELAGNIVNYNDLFDLEVISTADAEFLYNERRIDQFVTRR